MCECVFYALLISTDLILLFANLAGVLYDTFLFPCSSKTEKIIQLNKYSRGLDTAGLLMTGSRRKTSNSRVTMAPGKTYPILSGNQDQGRK